MANSRIGQYLLEYRVEGYSSPTRAHYLRLNVLATDNPPAGTPATSINIARKGGVTATLQAVADEVWSYLRLAYPTSINNVGFSLWKWVTDNARDFISGGTVTTPAGSTGSVVDAQQVTLTFRSALGGVTKIVLIEPNLTGSTQVALVPNAAGNPAQRIAAFMLSANSPLIANDNSFVIAGLRDSRGQNEAAFRRLFRTGY